VLGWLHAAPAGAASLGVLVGLGAGAGAVAFRYLVLWFTEAFSGQRDYSAGGRVANPHVPWLGLLFVVLAPAVGGLLYGPLIARFAPEARGHGVPEVMLAVAERGGRISPKVAIVKSLASAICIGSGGSVGREGPIVQIGSALGSTIGQLLRVPPTRLRLLVACGAAGGISATFNAPIAGVMFALELILRSFEAELFAVVVLASVTADIVGRGVFGDHPFLPLAGFHLVSLDEYLLYIGLGVAAALVGVAFIHVLYAIEDACDRVWPWKDTFRPAAGGLALGLLLLAVPEMYGVGYPVLQRAVSGRYVIGFLLVLLVAKMLATSLTIGIGGSGGIFAPSLFLGAMLGSAYGQAAHQLLPHSTAPSGAYALVGMAAVFAAAARAPITAVLIVFELTGDYRIILPLMCATVVATGLSSILSRDTIYSLKLRRRGVDLLQRRPPTLLGTLHVSAAMSSLPEPLAPHVPVAGIASRMAESGEQSLPVVDAQGAFRGIVRLHDVADALATGTPEHATAADLTGTSTASVRAGDTLETALELLATGGGALPVTDEEGVPVGWIRERDVLEAYTAASRPRAEPQVRLPARATH
jgi:CIC family chloride channel protein